ncbi:uracil-DNA glycosylase family protein [Chromobacterium sp. IIBBL 290-4]|uniref:uracil-DNA glycosylase family protein n=1 Tax=Chromobacterium sp. IIBBL 290-4 TaxID=2953890 RepID=UPI0020B638BE|nr:uracil-DNA glycosylase family protein [Chromobacterium sp. IIBBL 290-4]UTH73933.1 uracil-DNA glycosylase family protein [Chromobacterium sp. IIBBL 290-4]
MENLATLLARIESCRACERDLPNAPRPLLQASPRSRILLAGQAPGARAHESGTPWRDASGDRLREWLGVSESVFYNPDCFAIVPMGFCYPGRGKSGDLPPRAECRALWHPQLMPMLGNVRLVLAIGAYAQAYHLPDRQASLTETVRNWRAYQPACFPLPHPSPRNQSWLKRNPWFAEELLPALRVSVAQRLDT